MRSSSYVTLIVAGVILLDLSLFVVIQKRREMAKSEVAVMRQVVKELGLSDLALSTEARYTRHPAVSDPVVPFMDHPGSMEHFPSGSFWFPER